MNTETKPRVTYAGRHAVVLGGSLAGLLAARVLSDHFERVTLIERDAYPDTTEVRRGTPQANHVHGLLVRGRQILEQLFPGLPAELIAAGAPEVDLANDVAWFTRAGRGIKFKSDFKVLAFSRPLLDLHVRKRLSANPKIEILDNTDVLRLLPGIYSDRLAGVLVCPRNSDSDRRVAIELHADLIVDATGRASKSPRWLADLGYQTPQEIVIDAQLAYASRYLRMPSDFNADWQGAFIQASPPDDKRGGFLLKVEDNRWLLTLIGGGGECPPSDEQGFLDYARNLRNSTIFEAVKNAEPLTPIKTHRATQNRLRRYENARDLPENFLVVGDAVCAFNPVYGQGMTIAALGALTLQKSLQAQQRLYPDGSFYGLSRRFQRRLAKVNQTPWMLATSEDYRYREVAGGTASRTTRFMHRYMDHVIRLSTKDENVRRVLLRAFNMLVPPTALFRPPILFRVMRQAFFTAPKPKPQASTKSNRRVLYQAEARD